MLVNIKDQVSKKYLQYYNKTLQHFCTNSSVILPNYKDANTDTLCGETIQHIRKYELDYIN